MKKYLLVLLTFISVFAFGQDVDKKEKATINKDTLAKLESLVFANPEDLTTHSNLIKSIGFDNPYLETFYKRLSDKFPESAIIPYALGNAYAGAERPQAKKWLLKAIEIDPKMAKAYFVLWQDGERWGDFNASREYLKQAMINEPTDPNYAFYYRSSFKNVDPEKYKRGMLEMTKLFPQSERGAQSLYWLGLYVRDVNERLSIYSQLKNQYPPEKFNWSSSGMYDYFYLYLEVNPENAFELAKSMISASSSERDKKSWESRMKLASDLIQVHSLMAQNNNIEALKILDSTIQEKRSAAGDMITMLKAHLSDATGATNSAYNNLINYYASNPSDKIMESIKIYSEKLGKINKDIYSDIWKVRDSFAVQATQFSLEQYFVKERASLNDFKGKVILLTYWFPGCGPCRGEFPNFQNVINKFNKNEVVYIGINISPEQDEYVIPFMKSSGYTFIPLKDEEAKRGNLVAFGAPTNYLIDKKGRIIFKNFRTDSNNERTLELMIKETLDNEGIK